LTILENENKESNPYDLTAKAYDELYRREQFTKYDYIFKTLRLKPGDTVLDLGCGTALLYEYLVTNKMDDFKRYICVDPSIKMLEIANRKTMRDPRVITILCNGEDLPFIEEYVDVVYMFTVWDNLSDKRKTLMNVEKIVRRNGYVLISILPRDKIISKDKSAPNDLDPRFKFIGVKRDLFYKYIKQ
jgi:ubiquinone/menaquinone biosynthesis C-methylase UbiE